MSIANTVKETATEPLHWGRRHPWAAALLIVVVAIVVVRNSDTIKSKIADSAKGGSTISKGLAKLFGVSVPSTTATA